MASQQSTIAEKEPLMADLKERAMRISPEVCDPGHHKLVWGEGSLVAEVAFVGEAPGDKEEAEGRPFVGQAGKLLDRELKQLGINRNDLWITNAVKCRPVKESAGILVNRTPTAKEIKNWLGPLMEELEIIHPHIIVCLGAVAAKALINKSFALTKERGLWFDGPFDSRIIATFHPAYILRQVGDNWDIAMEMFRQDLRQALKLPLT
ncbi:MAG: uracil-DNA glycosylase [Armatimonadota bacterium]